MAQDNTVLGNFHQPSSNQHPANSIGNQQIFDQGRQVGSVEYIPDAQGNMRLQVNNTSGNPVFNLGK